MNDESQEGYLFTHTKHVHMIFFLYLSFRASQVYNI